MKIRLILGLALVVGLGVLTADAQRPTYIQWIIFPPLTSDPPCNAGEFSIWANITEGVLKKCQNGVKTNLDTGGGGGGTTVTVNGSALAASTGDLDDATPAAPGDGVNVRWQKDALTPTNISANLQFATGSVAGAVSTASQTFAGEKTFSSRVRILSTVDTASQELLRMETDRATPTANDELFWSGYLSDTLGTQTEYARFSVVARDIGAATKDGQFRIDLMENAALGEAFSIDANQQTVRIGKDTATTFTGNIAIGFDAQSTGNSDAIAIGHGAVASDNDAIAIGLINATGNSSTAIGRSNNGASGANSIAIGTNVNVTQTGAIGIGESLTNTQANSVAIGPGGVSVTQAAGADSGIAIGQAASITNVQNGVAIGSFATVTGTNGIAIGQATVSHSGSIAIGNAAASSAANQLTIGDIGSAGNRINTVRFGATRFGILDFSALATTDKTFTFPNASGEVSLLGQTIEDGELASNYSGVGACGANTFASTLNDNAAPTCTQPSFANLSGTADPDQLGGGTAADDKVLIGDSPAAATWRAIPTCNTVTEKTFYNTATNTWSCETDAGGGGAPTLDAIADPVAASDFIFGTTSETLLFDFQAAFTAGSQFLIQQSVGNPLGGTLFEVRAADANVRPLARFDMQADAVGQILVDSGSAAAQIAEVVLADRGVVQWSIRKDANNDFVVVDVDTLDLRILFVDGADVADAGAIRLANDETVAWEASPTGTDITLKVNASGQLVFSNLDCSTGDQYVTTTAGGAFICGTDDGGAGSGDNITVNTVAATDANLSDTDPAAPGSGVNVEWQLNTATTPDNVSGYIQQASVSQGGIVDTLAQTFNGKKTFDDGAIALAAAATTALELENPDTPADDSFADSPNFDWTAIRDSLAGAGVTREEVNWREFVDVTAVAGTSSYIWQSRIGAAAFAERAKLTDGGVLDVATGLRIAGGATTGRYLRGNGTNFIVSAGAASGTGTCTNQFPRTLNDDAAPTCASVAKADLPTAVAYEDEANVFIALQSIDNQLSLRLREGDAGGDNYTGFRAPSAITTDNVYEMPESTVGFFRSGTISTGVTPVTIVAETGTGSVMRATSPTGVTLDVEGTSNSITTVSKVWIPAATCVAATATNNWDDDPVVAEPTAACVAGTNVTKGVSDFLDAATSAFQTTFQLPSDWTGAVDIKFVWLTTVITNSVVWQTSGVCVATGATETDDPAFGTANTVTDTAAGTASQINDASITGIQANWGGTCAVGELLHLRIVRDPAHASDSLAATARLYGIELTMRRAQ